MKKLFEKLIQLKAKQVIKKFKPRIVAITGSVGKTSTKNAIAAVLKTKFSVRVAEENYNNEFGVPFAILGAKSPGRSPLGWLKLLLKTEKFFPEILVLEFGADQPGDISALCDLAAPEIGVVTAITPVHVENYGSDIDGLVAEKRVLIERLKANGLAVLNGDDDRVRGMAMKSQAPILTYGVNSSDVQASNFAIETLKDFSFEHGETFATLGFHVRAKDQDFDAALKNALSRTQVLSALAAIAVGQYLGLTSEEMLKGLLTLEPVKGRLNPVLGIKGSLILDDSYNAAPASTSAALQVLSAFKPSENRRRIAVLGDMGELGIHSEAEHRNLGLQAAGAGIDLLYCVGEKSRDTARGALEAGMNQNQVREFSNSIDAGRHLDQEIKQGDIVLIKGSQSARMEKVVKDIMAEPLRAGELLVRQYGKWVE